MKQCLGFAKIGEKLVLKHLKYQRECFEKNVYCSFHEYRIGYRCKEMELVSRVNILNEDVCVLRHTNILGGGETKNNNPSFFLLWA